MQFVSKFEGSRNWQPEQSDPLSLGYLPRTHSANLIEPHACRYKKPRSPDGAADSGALMPTSPVRFTRPRVRMANTDAGIHAATPVPVVGCETAATLIVSVEGLRLSFGIAPVRYAPRTELEGRVRTDVP